MASELTIRPAFPPSVGTTVRVSHYHTGDFIGRVEREDRDIVCLRVIDTLRPLPKIKDRCPFPGCVLRDFHDDDHQLTNTRLGGLVEVFWRNARFIPEPAL